MSELKKVFRVRYTYDINVIVDADTTPEDFDFLRNESSSCADNSLSELQDYANALDKHGLCLCDDFSAEVLCELSPPTESPQLVNVTYVNDEMSFAEKIVSEELKRIKEAK